ncbi:MAG: hypothetical protein IBX72_03430 [Nitrospirae bacterium]|jgi:TolB-like protein|nr:hypothetical protein [Nitrospirota bacterium]
MNFLVKAKGRGQRAKRSKIYMPSLMLCVLFSMLFGISSGYAQNPKETIAILPFENFSEDKNALLFVMPALRSKLEAEGFKLLDEESLNRFLLKERIRSTGYISWDMSRKMHEELQVSAILIGSVNSFSEKTDPEVGFTARLINASDGTIIWANHAAATGEDFTTILGLGRVKAIEKLADRLLDRLLKSFSIMPSDKEIESTYRIAVMPFYNKTKIRNIGMVVTNMFIVELFKNKKFIPIEFGEVRRLIVDLRVRERGEINFKNTEAIYDLSGVDGIIVGTVEIYKEGLESVSPPETNISARLIDARKNRILWSDFDHFKGDDDIIVLDWGRIRSAENVAFKSVKRLVKEISKAKWH